MISLSSAVFGEGGGKYLARHWESEDGLPGNSVTAVAQAADGYLWVGTADGVARFDGARFSGFDGGNARHALEPVRALFPLPNGEVWFTTADHDLLRGKGNRLEEIPLPPARGDFRKVLITQVVGIDSGDVLVARGDEVFRVNRGRVDPVTQPGPELLDHLRRDAAEGAERGRVVTGRGQATMMLRSRSNELWRFEAGKGLMRTGLDGRVRKVPLDLEAPSFVMSMAEDRQGNLWLGSRTQGLWQVRPARVEVLTTADGLSSHATRVVLEDRSGALWVASDDMGLDRLEGGAVSHFPIGTRWVSSLLETRDGALWTAMRDNRMFVRNDGAFKVVTGHYAPYGVHAMAEDDGGRIWLGSRTGLSVWDGNTRRGVDPMKGEVIVAVSCAGRIVWAGSTSGRLFRGDESGFEEVGNAAAVDEAPITSLLPAKDGGVWIGTRGAGLFLLRNNRMESMVSRMPYVDRRIATLLDDGTGFLWLGTSGGICRVDKAKLLDGRSLPGEAVLVLDRSDGLLTSECSQIGQPGSWQTRDGKLLFCTRNGLAVVRPDRLALDETPPPVVIEQTNSSGVPVAPDNGRVAVGPGRSRLEFQFSALTFTAPEKVRFRTRLEGLDDDWRDVGNQRAVSYEAVPPGRYRFQVIAANGDGAWNRNGASLNVVVRPRYWETAWFRMMAVIAAAVVAVGTGALVTRARMRGRVLRLKARNAREMERARIARDLHDDLGASLTEISLLAHLAGEERRGAADDDGTLAEIADSAQNLVGALDEIVWAANPRYDTLRSLAEYLASFAERFLGRAGIALRRDVPRDLPDVKLDAELRHSVFLAAREALNNVVKHSGAGQVRLRVRWESQVLAVEIEDDGCGIVPSPSSSSGEGLGNLKSRLVRHGGTCEISSSSESGTCISLKLPLHSSTVSRDN